jgi:hypothetical protein
VLVFRKQPVSRQRWRPGEPGRPFEYARPSLASLCTEVTRRVWYDSAMNRTLREFDMRALHATVDAERRRRGLTWAALIEEVNRAFEGTPSTPISLSTVRGMQDKTSVTSAVALQVLRWSGRSPESFLIGGDHTSHPDDLLPEPGPGRILRFDTRAMHAALDAERVKRGMTWNQVAGELPGFTESMLRNLATGPLIGFPRVMMITQWLGRPAVSFARAQRR